MKPMRFFLVLFLVLFLAVMTIRAWADLTTSIAGNYKTTFLSSNAP